MKKIIRISFKKKAIGKISKEIKSFWSNKFIFMKVIKFFNDKLLLMP